MPTNAELYATLTSRTNQAIFAYDGISSDSMDLVISKETAQTSPEADVSFQPIPGRDGSLIIDNKRLKNFIYPIHAFLMPTVPDIHVTATKISQWLKGDVRYKELYLSWDPDYVYKAVYNEQFSITDMLPKFGKVALNFKCHPIKYHTSGQIKLAITSGMAFLNAENRSSKPLIKIIGNGDITLNKNGVNWLVLTAVDGYIVVDSESMSVFDANGNQFNKMNATLSPMFPQLTPGVNTIAWSELGFTVEITPRWEAVV